MLLQLEFWQRVNNKLDNQASKGEIDIVGLEKALSHLEFGNNMLTKKKKKEVDQKIKETIDKQIQEKATTNLEPIKETNEQKTIEKTKLVFTNKDNNSAIVELTQLDKKDISAQIRECECKIERLMQEHKTRQDKKVIQSS